MNKLSDAMINANENTFITILEDALKSRDIEADILIKKLLNNDFFTAPASTKYHASYKGGLCEHSLNVYYNMMNLAKMKGLLIETRQVKNEETGEIEEVTVGSIPESSIAIVALLHDFSKMNLYTTEYRNKKVYSEHGTKRDENGNFDWVSVASYATVPVEERFLYGNHESTSEFMTRQFIPLTYEESIAIMHHHCGMNYDSNKDIGQICNIYNRYPIAILLHLADMMSCYVDESTEKE